MNVEKKEEIDSLDGCMKYFILLHRPYQVKHIEDFMGSSWRVGVLMKKYLTNEFRLDDNRYYYLVFKKRWWNSWAETENANVTKYHNKPGVTISSRIYTNMQMNSKYRNLGALVIAFPDMTFHYIKCVDFLRFATRYDTIFDSRFGDIEVGLAAECYNYRRSSEGSNLDFNLDFN